MAEPENFIKKQGIAHKNFIGSLENEAALQTWHQFSHHFWKVSAVGSALNKSEFLFRRGFYRDKWNAYGLDNNPCEAYLSDIQSYLLHQVNGIYANVVNDNLLQIHTLKDYFITPQVYAVRPVDAKENSYCSIWDSHLNGDPDARDIAIVIRPQLANGKGKMATARISQGHFSGFGKQGELKRLSHIVKDWSIAAGSPYLFLQDFQPSPFCHSLNPGGAHTLHILMGREHDSWEPQVIAAILKISQQRSDQSTQIEKGGLSAWIDLNQGKITDCLQLSASGQPEPVEIHPDSLQQIVGITIPDWENIRKRLIQMFDESSYLRVCAFDFVLTDQGLALSAATMPDTLAIQMHRPIFSSHVLAEQLYALKFLK